MDLKSEFERVLGDITWNFIELLNSDKKLYPIPKDINIQSLFEYLATGRIKELAKVKRGLENL